jgi:hypothetical protein
LRQQQLQLKVLADNGADVYINGVKFLQDYASDHDPVYWNNIVPVNGTNTAFVAGATAALLHHAACSIASWHAVHLQTMAKFALHT